MHPCGQGKAIFLNSMINIKQLICKNRESNDERHLWYDSEQERLLIAVIK